MGQRLRSARVAASIFSYFLPPTGLAVVFTLLSISGTSSPLSVWHTLVFWLLVVCTNWALCDVAIRRVDRVLAPETPLRSYFVPMIGSSLVLIPQIGVVLLGVQFIADGAYQFDLLVLAARVACVSLLLSLLVFNLNQGVTAYPEIDRAPAHAPLVPSQSSSVSPSAAADFKRKLTNELGASIFRVQSEDHYIRVYSGDGRSVLLLGNLSDAVSCLGDEGLQIHRSWWVARAAIVSVKFGASSFVQLSDGTEVPIGRSFYAKVKESGFPRAVQHGNPVSTISAAEQRS